MYHFWYYYGILNDITLQYNHTMSWCNILWYDKIWYYDTILYHLIQYDIIVSWYFTISFYNMILYDTILNVSCDTILYIMRILYHTLQYEIEYMYNAILYHIIWCVKTIKSNISYTRSLTNLIC